MTKKVLLVFLALGLILSLTACPGLMPGEETVEETAAPTASQTPDPTVTEPPTLDEETKLYAYESLSILYNMTSIPDGTTVAVESNDTEMNATLTDAVYNSEEPNYTASGTLSITGGMETGNIIFNLVFSNDPDLSEASGSFSFDNSNMLSPIADGTISINDVELDAQEFFTYLCFGGDIPEIPTIEEYAYFIMSQLYTRQTSENDDTFNSSSEDDEIILTFTDYAYQDEILDSAVNGTIVYTQSDETTTGTYLCNLLFTNDAMGLTSITVDFEYTGVLFFDPTTTATGTITINDNTYPAQNWLDFIVDYISQQPDEPELTEVEEYTYETLYTIEDLQYDESATTITTDYTDEGAFIITYNDTPYNSQNTDMTVSGTISDTSELVNESYIYTRIINLTFTSDTILETITANYTYEYNDSYMLIILSGAITINGTEYPAENYINYY